MDEQQEASREAERLGAPSSGATGNPLLLPGMTRRVALAECVILLLWLLLGWMFTGRCARAWGSGLEIDFMRTETLPAVAVAVGTVGLGALLLRFQRLPWTAIALYRDRLDGQVLWGIGAALVTFGVVLGWAWLDYGVRWSLWKLGYSFPSGVHGANPWAAVQTNATVGTVLILWGAVAVGEEVLFRGLLLPRLRRVTGRWWVAVLATSLLFGVGHVGWGREYVVPAFLMSVAWCLVFIRSRSLLAVVTAHFLYNSGLYAQRCWLHGAG